MKIKFFLNFKILILSLIIIFPLSNKALSSDLDGLFNQLKYAKNISLAKEYEDKIWKFWLSDGTSENNNIEMMKGVDLMQKGKLDDALKLFINLSESDPNWAEPINKIATIRYLQGDLYGSIRDIQLTLELEPRHFGAIAGLAQINLALGRYTDALKNLDFAIDIHPYIGIKNLKPIILDLIEKSQI